MDVTPRQYKALGHPQRHRMLTALRRRPATIAQLAAALGSPKGTVGYHVKVLVDAGLVRQSESRTVRGGTERYFEATPGALVHDQHGAEFLLRAALAEMVPPSGDEVEHTMLRHVWLTPARARALVERIEAWGHEPAQEEEAADASAYGVLLSVFRADIPRLPPA
ncbi:winged helix-turn-helix domain-containing protein [Asanoa sp. WMMD1127]|uniref:ArsR/SmtB family transcription factor n=1 Tax=Asanoa sp. WMMD1127 TaxID=3016107 RepID=UPI002416EF2A|nr:winged helix-turn-helix domain-containing protein [Asanoa sp. WMMD1127]MDG4827394.1 winged helix-turn-helix domain-containing protein [Asanoa sp. WMMD1127]